MKTRKKSIDTFRRFATLCAFLMLISISIVAIAVARKEKAVSSPQSEETAVSEYIYVYVTDISGTSEALIANEEWIAYAYNDKIGIFDTNGELLYVIETYIKTLPSADRDLLREGIEIKTKNELLSLIEDYSS